MLQQLKNATVLGAFLLACTSFAAPKDRSAGVDFSRDIRPILSDNCFACHGPDEKERKAKLRFDRHEDALKPAKSGDLAIVPGDTKKSKLIERITSTDEDEVMPPPKTKKKLTQQQKDLLTRWIAEGAKWQSHWAFEAPKHPAPPEVKNKKWVRNDIDPFVLARLEKEKLKPSPEADKTTLVRRATLDLTGLPPTTEEVDAFLADKSPQAYEKVVDRLLNTPRYGEHMARYWLDASRYADSHGYHIDSERSMWKWRDWVINAFNNNMPYDQFTLEQLAGDLLPEATLEQKIASGYVRCNMSTGEGGALTEEYQAKYTFDRVETTSTIWMGLTLTCARCHTHKYDPITHKEYYGMYSFFNNLNEAVMDGNKPNPDPFIKLPSPEQAARQAELKKLVAKGQEKIDAPMPELDQAQQAWEAKWRQKLSAGWTVLSTTNITSTNGSEFKVLEDQSILVQGENPPKDLHEITIPVSPGSLAALRLEAIPDSSLPKESASRADDGGFRLSELEAELIRPGKDPKKIKFAQALADSARDQNEADKAIDGKPETGWQADPGAVTEPHAILFLPADPVALSTNSELKIRLRYEASTSKRAIGRFRLAAAQDEELVQLLAPPKPEPWQVIGPFKASDPQTGLAQAYEPEKEVDLKKTYPGVREEIKWNAKADFEDGKANLLVQDLHGVHGVYYLYRTIKTSGSRKMEVQVRADDLFKLWVNGKQVAERTVKEKPGEAPVEAVINLKTGENKILLKVATQQGAAYFTFRKDLDEADTVPADIAALFAGTKKFNSGQQTKARNYFRRQNSPDLKKVFDDLAKWRDEEGSIEKAIPTTMVAKDMEKPRETFMLMRGEYDKPGDKVGPGVPAVLPPFPKDTPTNRLGLARWLLDPSHPLTARVTVNRFWQQYFGVGLVKTAEDFGMQGEHPSHPELLDWLATEFVRSGWDVKKLQKLIVTSATYRQASKVDPRLYAKDPENRLLARGPRFRVDGEVVRDSALAISGLLVQKAGGRSVRPYEPPGLWEAVSFNNSQKYVPDKGDGQWRRSLYTYWKRQSPPPNMMLFDSPTREYCVVRRPRTNTPLQALALLNDPQFVESARAFAHRMLKQGGPTAETRLAYGFRLATARQPTRAEVRVLEDVLKKQLAEFQANQEAAQKFLSVGTWKADSDCDAAELAAWTTVASMVLNLDETVTKN
jgi:hypothetical protein